MSFNPHMEGIHRALRRELLRNSRDHSWVRRIYGQQSFLEQRSMDFHMLSWVCDLARTNYLNQNLQFWEIGHNQPGDSLALDLCGKYPASGCRLYLRWALRSIYRLIFPWVSSFRQLSRTILLLERTPLPGTNLSLFQ